MPKLSGKDIISETTEKVIRRTLVISAAAILTKWYEVPLSQLKVLGMDLPATIIDTALLVLVVFSVYSLIINWTGDLLAFRLWFRENAIWSMFNTNMKLDGKFISGGIPLLLRLHQMEKDGKWPVVYSELDDESKKDFESFKTNVELYCTRLDYAGQKFSVLTYFGQYYVWVHSFAFPVGLSIVALYVLVKHGQFILP